MRSRDIRPGMTVYHTVMVHWGKGTVQHEVRKVVASGFVGYREVVRWSVLWSLRKKSWPVVCRADELRKTPNKAKIRKINEIRAATGRKPIPDV